MTVTVTVTDEAWAEPPRVRLDVTAAGVVGADLGITRTHGDGTSYPVLLESRPRVIGGSWVGYDYHAPLNTPVTYTVAVVGEAPAVSGEVLLPADAHWLMHPRNPALSIPLTVAIKAYGDQKFLSNAVAYRVIGSSRPVVVSDGRRAAETGTVTAKVTTPEDKAALEALLADDGPVLLNRHTTDGWEPGWLWMQPGELTLSNPAGHPGFWWRYVTFSYAVVAQPDQDSGAAWSCDDVVAEFATCNAVLSAFGSAAGLVSNTRVA